MKRSDPPQPDGLIDVLHEAIIAVPCTEVVARGEGVTGVDTDAEALRMADAVTTSASCSNLWPMTFP